MTGEVKIASKRKQQITFCMTTQLHSRFQITLEKTTHLITLAL